MTCFQNSEVPSGDGLGTGLIYAAGAAGSITAGGGSATGVSGTGLVLFILLQSARLAVVPPNQLGGRMNSLEGNAVPIRAIGSRRRNPDSPAMIRMLESEW
jgi:hypothetical protein